MNDVKRFHLGDVLSITTGALVSRDHMAGVYAILNHMTGEDLFTHQLPRAMDDAQPYLFDQFPELRAVHFPGGLDSKEAVFAWVDEQAATYGEWFAVKAIPAVARMPHDPIVDAVAIAGPRGVHVVVTD